MKNGSAPICVRLSIWTDLPNKFLCHVFVSDILHLYHRILFTINLRYTRIALKLHIKKKKKPKSRKNYEQQPMKCFTMPTWNHIIPNIIRHQMNISFFFFLKFWTRKKYMRITKHLLLYFIVKKKNCIAAATQSKQQQHTKHYYWNDANENTRSHILITTILMLN